MHWPHCGSQEKSSVMPKNCHSSNGNYFGFWTQKEKRKMLVDTRHVTLWICEMYALEVSKAFDCWLQRMFMCALWPSVVFSASVCVCVFFIDETKRELMKHHAECWIKCKHMNQTWVHESLDHMLWMVQRTRSDNELQMDAVRSKCKKIHGNRCPMSG